MNDKNTFASITGQIKKVYLTTMFHIVYKRKQCLTENNWKTTRQYKH